MHPHAFHFESLTTTLATMGLLENPIPPRYISITYRHRHIDIRIWIWQVTSDRLSENSSHLNYTTPPPPPLFLYTSGFLRNTVTPATRRPAHHHSTENSRLASGNTSRNPAPTSHLDPSLARSCAANAPHPKVTPQPAGRPASQPDPASRSEPHCAPHLHLY